MGLLLKLQFETQKVVTQPYAFVSFSWVKDEVLFWVCSDVQLQQNILARVEQSIQEIIVRR